MKTFLITQIRAEESSVRLSLVAWSNASGERHRAVEGGVIQPELNGLLDSHVITDSMPGVVVKECQDQIRLVCPHQLYTY